MLKQVGNELIKFMKLKHGYGYVLLFIVINVGVLFNGNSIRTNLYAEEAEELLSFYYEKWGGTYDSSMDMEATNYYAYVLSDNYNIAKDTIIPVELKEKIIDEGTVEQMFKRFYAALTLAKNNERTDAISDVRGYEIMLQQYKSIDFFFLLIVIIMTCVIFSVDKQRGQEDIVKATVYGNKTVIKAKMLLAALIIVLFEAIKVVFVCVPVLGRFNMPSLGTPLQNLAYMHNVSVKLSVGEAFAFLITCEIIGLVFISLICGLVIVSNVGSAEGFICGFAAAYVPFFLFNKECAYRNIPLPSAYLAPYNFLEYVDKYKVQYIVVLLLVVALVLITSRVYTYGLGIDKRRLK